MAEAPSPATTKPELPTIIIDPSIYEPEHAERPQTLITNFMRLTRVTLAVTAVGGATIGVAHMVELDSLLPATQVAALTDILAEVTAKPAKITAPPAVAEVAEIAAPEGQEPPAPAPSLVEVFRAQALAAQPPSAEPPSTQAPSTASASDEVPPAIAPHAPAPVKDAPNRLSQTRPTVPIVPEKAQKEPSVQGELRNARRLLALNQLEAAEAAYRRVLAEKQDEQAALTGLARVQLALGQLDLALVSAKRAVDEAPEAASARLALGDILRARGDKKAAQASYDVAAQLTPSVAAEQ